MKISNEDLERLSSLQPHEIPRDLHPDVRRAVVDRMIEKRQGQPRAPKKSVAKPVTSKRRKKIATVKQGEGGRIESLRRPIAPAGGVSPEKPKPVVTPAPTTRTKTRTGKKIDKATGKVAVASVKQGEGGKIVALTEEEKTAARTTVLPTVEAKPEAKPQGLMGMGARPVTKGAASGNYPQIKAAVEAARNHLVTMQQAPKGSQEHHDAHEAFNAIHANILKMSPELHTSLGQAKHFVTNPGKGSDKMLALTHQAINTRLGIIRTAHEENLRRSAEGRLKKAGN